MTIEDDESADLEDLQFSHEELKAIEALENRASDVLVTTKPPKVSPVVQIEPSLSEVVIPCQEAPVRTPSPSYSSISRATTESSSEIMKIRRLNLFRVFRPLGSLSVTDLVGPQWCELKFEYTLRWGNRWERVKQKPSHIVTARGKRIQVEKSTAKQSEVVMDSGRSIHKKLERAIQPDEVVIPVVTGEERIASKLLTMISGFRLLKTLGYCREFPVMGIEDDILIIGVIDEIVRKKVELPKPALRTKKERARDARQRAITQFLSPSEPKFSDNQSTSGSETSETPPSQHYTLCLIDNKSRSLPSIPPERDRIASRLQLMLYKRLLENILKPSSFLQTLAKYSVNLRAPFSPKFLQAQEILCVSNDLSEVTRDAMCLTDLMVAFNDAVSQLCLSPHPEESLTSSIVDNELILVYRARKPDDFNPGPRKRARRHGLPRLLERSRSSNGNLLEADVRERSLESDLKFQFPAPPVEIDSSSAGEPATPLSTIQELATTMEENVEVSTAIISELEKTAGSVNDFGQDYFGSNTPLGDAPPGRNNQPLSELITTETTPRPAEKSPPLIPPSHLSCSEELVAPVIGCDKFMYDSVFLNAYLVSILEFWRGQRDAEGVDIEDSRRCDSCQFRDGCEWREAKANEFLLATNLQRAEDRL